MFSAPMCPVVLFLQTVSVTASVFTSVAVGIDRYWIVNFPLKSRITKSRSPAVIGAIWFAACTLSSIQLVVGRSNPYTSPTGQQVYLCFDISLEVTVIFSDTDYLTTFTSSAEASTSFWSANSSDTLVLYRIKISFNPLNVTAICLVMGTLSKMLLKFFLKLMV